MHAQNSSLRNIVKIKGNSETFTYYLHVVAVIDLNATPSQDNCETYPREFIKTTCDTKEFCAGEIPKELSRYISFLRKEENSVLCEGRPLALSNRFFASADHSSRP